MTRAVHALLALVVVGVALGPAAAQEQMRVEGVVQSISGETLTLLADSRGQVMISPSLVPLPAARPTVTIDLGRLPPAEYSSIAPGEHIGVTGVVSRDGRRVTATAITRASVHQAPQAP